MNKVMIKATGPFERIVHWCLAISCLILCASGMVMMYHSLQGFGTLVGGMTAVKTIHNYSGVFFAVSLFLALLVWWKEAGMFSSPEDWQWFKVAGGYLWKVDQMPEIGKYNPGQKLFFLTIVIFGTAMVVSGFFMWFPLGYEPGLIRFMYVLHALGFVIIFAFFWVHLYLVTLGAPGSASAMFTGWVSKGWARTQHPKWLREMEEKGTLVVYGKKGQSGRRC
jgi:formate dehydrogenase subunit gamma